MSELGAGPFGTVTVTEDSGTLKFLLSLEPGYRIHDGNANHNAFSFSILGNPNITVSDLTSGFTAISTSNADNVSSPPFGIFFSGVDCTTACGPGYAGGYAGDLSFTVSAASPLSIASLGSNNGVYFTSDLINERGKTGNVGATIATSAVPEPATWAMMLVGFGGIGAAMRRKPKVTTRIRFA
ncbi:MAG: PEPxxWA-CTERM sorting domain-containing protein [Sphingomonas sp.]|nr:PEPxxWA-CTERM sorting domain-containing protein [Sphingomonas sp.]